MIAWVLVIMFNMGNASSSIAIDGIESQKQCIALSRSVYRDFAGYAGARMHCYAYRKHKEAGK